MSILNEAATIARHHVFEGYLKLWHGAAILIGIVVVMWGLNLAGFPGFNLFIGMLGALGLAFIMFSPKAVFVFFGLGAVVAELNDKDITQGAVAGVTTQYRVFLAAAYCFMALAGLLGTWTFQASPMAFWVIAFFGTFLTIMAAYYKSGSSKWMHRIGILYAIMVILMAIAGTFTGTSSGVLNKDLQKIPNPVASMTSTQTTPTTKQARLNRDEMGDMTIQLAPGRSSDEVVNFQGSAVCFNNKPKMKVETKLADGEWYNGDLPHAWSYRFTNLSSDTMIVDAWRKPGHSC